MTHLSKIVEAMETIAPLQSAEPWDNVGLLCGDPRQSVNRILLTIDYTSAVAAEAIENNCDCVIAYHPPIFTPLKKLTAGSLIFDAIRRGVAIYSPHTALDSAADGANDVLAGALGLTDLRPLRSAASKDTPANYKLVAFVPESALEKVSHAVFDAGAGYIGKYSSCAFSAPGTGTFFGNEGTNPAVGQPGKLERAPEIRFETIVPASKAGDVIRALKENHPYEEPAYDLHVLADAKSGSTAGMGRIGDLPPTDRPAIFARIKIALSLSHLLIAGPEEGAVTRAAVCAGSCGDMLDDAIAAGAQLYLTGEMRHHDAVKAAAAGLTVVCTLHSNSERAVLPKLKSKLEQFPQMPAIRISTADADPFRVR
jgi:dinuclear metal center YbgI/SA1388 family protein